MRKNIAKKLIDFLTDGRLEVDELRVGENTIKIDANSITFHPLTADPTLEVGKIWFRRDLQTILYSPDGMNIRSLVDETKLVKVQSPSYIIYQEDGIIYALNCKTGQIDFSGTDAYTVIQSTLNALTPERTWKEKVVLKGKFDPITNKILVPAKTIIEVQGMLKAGYIASMFEVRGDDVEFHGGVYDGNRDVSGLYVHAINTNGYKNVLVRDIQFTNLYVGVLTRGEHIKVMDCEFSNTCQVGVGNWDSDIPSIDIQIIRCRFYGDNAVNFDSLHAVTARDFLNGLLIDGCVGIGTLKNGTIGIALASHQNRPFRNIQIVNSFFTDYGDQIIHSETETTGGGHTFNFIISNCFFDRTNRYGGVALGLASGQYHYGVHISNVRISRAAGAGLHVEVGDVATLSNVITSLSGRQGFEIYGGKAFLTNCVAVDSGQAQTATYYGFSITSEAKLTNCYAYQTGTKTILRGASIYGSYSEIVNCAFYGEYHGLHIEGANYVKVLGGVYTSGWHGRISLNNALYTMIRGATIAKATTYGGVEETGTTDYTIVTDNYFTGTGRAVVFVGANSKAYRNINYVTENSGIATFSGDGSTKSFLGPEHGLAITDPNKITVRVSPISTDARDASPVTGAVDPTDNTRLRFYFASPPIAGTDNVVVAWKAEVG